jgi:hypothetical protein
LPLATLLASSQNHNKIKLRKTVIYDLELRRRAVDAAGECRCLKLASDTINVSFENVSHIIDESRESDQDANQ